MTMTAPSKNWKSRVPQSRVPRQKNMWFDFEQLLTMNKNIILFLLAAIAFGGCRKQVAGYDRPDFNPQPTLNAILSQGQPVWVQVSLAQCLDSVHPAACTDAEVLFYVDGQFVEAIV